MSEQQHDELANPMGLDGFSFIEYADTDATRLAEQFHMLGLCPIAKHHSKNITLYRQGEIHFILNNESESHAVQFAHEHGPAPTAMGFVVEDALLAFDRAVSLGATVYDNEPAYDAVPAIYGIGGSLIYFVDKKRAFFNEQFSALDQAVQDDGVGLILVDHLTHNVYRGNMDVWAHDFYKKLFSFRQIRYFDIKGKHTGLISRALRSPCNKITIPLNEATDDQSQIEEYLKEFKGEGIQHIAMSTNDIYQTVEALRSRGIQFMSAPPDTYYEMVEERLAGHGEDLKALQQLAILIDGSEVEGGHPKFLLQIFTENMLGPVFFEIIQRKGDEGFGEGNFTALFESIERDQIRRGVLNVDSSENAR